MHWTPGKIVIAFVAGQGEVIQVGEGVGGIPVMVAQGGEEAIFICSRAESAIVRGNILVIKLADVRIDRGRLPAGVLLSPTVITKSGSQLLTKSATSCSACPPAP